MIPIQLTKNRVTIAFAVALVADIVQVPLLIGILTPFAPLSEGLDLVVDFGVMATASVLLGFHWVFLPSALLEAVPFIDAIPTWTACVGYVVWLRRKEGLPMGDTRPIPQIRKSVIVSSPTPPSMPPHLNGRSSSDNRPIIQLPTSPPPAGGSPAQSAAAGRLQQLELLHRQGLISETEYATKRRRVLEEI